MKIPDREVADRIAITDSIYRYCRAVDRLDLELGYGVFHEDGVVRFPSYEGSGRGWIDLICARHAEFLSHSHQVTNVIIEVNGDHAGSESYVIAKLWRRDGESTLEHEVCGRYVDAWSKRDDEWRIDHRECIVDLDQFRKVTPVGVGGRARRDRHDPSYAVLDAHRL